MKTVVTAAGNMYQTGLFRISKTTLLISFHFGVTVGAVVAVTTCGVPPTSKDWIYPINLILRVLISVL